MSSRRLQIACALVVFLNACVWALVTPSFHVPDEPQHVAYLQYLAETGKLPTPIQGAEFSQEEGTAFDGVGFNAVVGNPDARPPRTRSGDEALEALLKTDPDRRSDGAFGTTTNNPPLYYLVETIPYELTSGADFWTRLLAMRLTSALLIGFTALFVFAFLRELLPGRRLAWVAGALAAGLTPLVGFIGGGVNNDAGLALAGAATLYGPVAGVPARPRPARRRPRRALLRAGRGDEGHAARLRPRARPRGRAAARRQWGDRRRDALAGLGGAAVAIAVPVALYLVAIATFWDRPLWTGGVAIAGTGQPGAFFTFRELLSYVWLFYFPRVPGQIYDPGSYGLWDVWFKGWIGRFGWLDYGFAPWVYSLAGWVWVGMLLLMAVGLWRHRTAVRARWGELLTYVALAVGTLLVINIQGYRYRIDTGGLIFEQARYLFPLLGLYAAIVAVAVSAVGKRAAPAVAAVFVALTLAHGLGALAITVARYYG